MHEANIKNLDLNLLSALNALLEERNVTRAAQRIHLSQPAMSRALARLRDMFQDPLLVKSPKGMILTSRANALYEPLQVVLRDIAAMISPPSASPADMQGEIIFGAPDYESAVILPKVIARITTEAPNIRCRIIPLGSDEIGAIQHNQADYVFTNIDSKAANLYRHVYQEHFTCLAAESHRLAGKSISLDDYLAAKHCVISTSGLGLGIIDQYLNNKNLKRNIVARVPYFLAATYVIAESDLLLALPSRLACLVEKSAKVVSFPLPLNIPSFSLYVYWHAKNQENAMHRWVRGIIKECL